MAIFFKRRENAVKKRANGLGMPAKKFAAAKIGIICLLFAVLGSVIGPSLLAIGTDLPVIPKTYAALGDPCHVPGTPGTLMTGFEQADGSCGSPARTGLTSDAALSLGQLSSFLVHMFSPFITFEAVLIGALMGNEFIMGTGYATDARVVEIGALLNTVWRVMRDIVNYGFILVLLAIAFMTVITAGTGAVGGSSFNVKQILPKFVVAVVLVNFTWFGARVILDAANVTAHIVYGIPISANVPINTVNCVRKGTVDTLPKGQRWCPTYCSDITLAAPDGETTVGELKSEKFGLITCNKWENFEDWSKFGQNNIAMLFAYSIFSVEELPMNAAVEGSLLDVTIHAIVAFVIMLLIFTVFTALFFVFLERVIILWLNIIFSPVAVLFWVMKGAFGTSAPNNKYLGLNVFIKYAFLPATVGVPLVIGFILVNAGNNLALPIPFAVNMGDISSLIPHVSTLSQLFWFLIALGIMWTSMSIAEDAAQLTGGVVKSIKQGAEGFGKFIVKSPVFAPWIPVKTASGEVKRGSLAMIPALGKTAGGYWEGRLGADMRELAGDKLDKELKRITDKMGDHEKIITAALSRLKNGEGFTKVMTEEFKGKIDAEEIRHIESATGPQQERMITELLRKVGREGEDVKQFMGGNMQTFQMKIPDGSPVEAKISNSMEPDEIARILNQAFKDKGYDKSKTLSETEMVRALNSAAVTNTDKVAEVLARLRTDPNYGYKIEK